MNFAGPDSILSTGSIAFGAAKLSLAAEPDDAAALATIRAALDAGVRMIDTALAYTTVTDESHSEALLTKALRDYDRRDEVLIATKGGHFRAGAREFPVDGRPETLRRHCDISLRTLGVERIGLYYLHHPDPAVPFTDSIGALHDLRQAGKIGLIGISNVDIGQIETASTIARIDAVQNHFSLYDERDRKTLEYCTEHGIAYLAYSPLHGDQAQRLAGPVGTIAARHGVSAARVVLAWNLRQSPLLRCIVGATRPVTIEDSVRAADLVLTEEDLTTLGRVRDFRS